jgi:GNAT superfamily N-acetyltransferase
MSDAGAIAELLRALGWFPHLKSEPFETTRQRIASRLSLCHLNDSHSAYVAEESVGGVMGYATVHWMPTLFLSGPEGYVSELFVEERARGQGAGTKLVQAVQEEAKERECSRLVVLNQRRRESYKRGFYRKCGWEERLDAANFIWRLK